MNIVYALGGLVLLLFGRRLFWFFVAAAGFSAGIFWARDQLHLSSELLVLAIALVAGLVGALLSVFLQKLAIALAGFASGGYLAAMFLKEVHSEGIAWVGFIVGGILGAVLLLTVFDWALIVLSALVGAAFFADGVGTKDNALLVFAVSVAVGVLVQTLQLRHSRKGERRPERKD